MDAYTVQLTTFEGRSSASIEAAGGLMSSMIKITPHSGEKLAGKSHSFKQVASKPKFGFS